MSLQDDEMFPLHARWNSYPFGSNEHYAVACALGVGGLTKVPKPVKRTRPFFTALRDAGLIVGSGNASDALKDELQDKKALKNSFTTETSRHEEETENKEEDEDGDEALGKRKAPGAPEHFAPKATRSAVNPPPELDL